MFELVLLVLAGSFVRFLGQLGVRIAARVSRGRACGLRLSVGARKK
jgi:hypothetical protein